MTQSRIESLYIELLDAFGRLALFALLLGLRWMTIPDVLPQTWTPSTEIKYTARLLEEPEHTDSKTIITRGVWRIEIPGYIRLMPGRVYAFSGKVVPRMLMGKVIKIGMMEPSFEEVNYTPTTLGERVVLALTTMRARMEENLSRRLPEPHSSLSAGILLGVKGSLPWDFYQKLVSTGTVHVVAASGYNVSIVAGVVMGVLFKFVSRRVAVLFGIIAIIGYTILAGGDAPIVRAAIMGGLAITAYYFGRPVWAKRLLWVSGIVMLLVEPRYLVDVGFWLSISATAGILYLEPQMRKLGSRLVIGRSRYLSDYLYPTLAANVFTLPIILLVFSRVSWISPLVNVLVLPLTPLIMFLTAVTLLLDPIPILGFVSSLLLYVPLELFIEVVRMLG